MTIVKYSLDQFTTDMESLIKGNPDEPKLFDSGSSLLERPVSKGNVIPAEYRLPAVNGSLPNHGTYPLYQGEGGLSVTVVVWGPGEHFGPHEHLTWGMIGILNNS